MISFQYKQWMEIYIIAKSNYNLLSIRQKN